MNANLNSILLFAGGGTAPAPDTFDISSLQHNGDSFDVGDLESTPQSLVFSEDGTNMYVVGTAKDTVYQYSLSTAFDVTTASLVNSIFFVSAQETGPRSLAFENSGNNMYIIGSGADVVYQYNLTTAFDLSTASYSGNSFDVTAQENNVQAVQLNSDGTKMYVAGLSTDTVYEYDLSTAYDVSTATYNNVSFSVGTQESGPNAIEFNGNGTKMFVTGAGTDTVYEYDLSTGFDVSTATYNNVSFSVGTQDATVSGVSFSPNGTRMYMAGDTNNTIYQYDLSTGFDLSTAAYNSVSLDVAFLDTSIEYAVVSDDGTSLFVLGAQNDAIFEFTLSTAFDISTATFAAMMVGSQDGTPQDLFITPDGTRLFMVGSSTDTVYQYSLSTAFDISTLTYDSVSFDAGFNVVSLHISPSGDKMYLVNTATDSVVQYTMSTAFDLSTATADSVTVGIGSQEPSPESFILSPDGTRGYVTGTTSDSIHQYNLSTAFDISTLSFSGTSLSVSSQDASPQDILWNATGSRFYVMGGQTDTIYQYDAT